MIELPPLSLYVHVPWCVRKCPYCDFNSHAARGAVPQTEYLSALLRDLEQLLPWVAGREIISIFFGGGTPSLLEPAVLAELLQGVARHLNLAGEVEITLEANPGTVDSARFLGFRRAGINRLSLGIQSFDARALVALGRIHGRREALDAPRLAREAGFDNLNLDLMFGLPNQQTEDALRDLETALELSPAHISWYQLTLEPNTRFYQFPPPLPGDDEIWAMWERGLARLAAAGFEHYEVSAHARPGRRCRHNLNYWRFGDYLGVGAGAHGKLTDPETGQIWRYQRPPHPRAYLQAFAGGKTWPPLNATRLSEAELPLEFMLNALRLVDGFEPELFSRRTGLPRESLQASLERAEQRGWLENSPQRIRPTPAGMNWLNELLELFIEDAC